ncbi:TetR/AcrR family transcriptional regulator [Streptomyces sp. NPDC021020]|uniref:TetR/AcrR family transcriptional regulator n=1 Tax=Streptomyces sp. NPDC021020 TaxID=3365109 RepID=UPI0037872B30
MPQPTEPTGAPALPWERPRRSAPRRTFSREAVVTAALHVIDTEGVEAMTMRRVAQELGTGPASLYAHVSGREEMIVLVLDRVLADVTCPEPDPQRWREQIKDVARDGRRALVAHGDLARLLPEIGVPTGESITVHSEGMLAILAAAGLPKQVCAYAVDALSMYVTGIAAEEASRAYRARSGGPGPDTAARVEDYIAALPPDRFPMLTGMVAELARDVGDERFEFGLDLMVTGLAAHLPAS